MLEEPGPRRVTRRPRAVTSEHAVRTVDAEREEVR